MGTLKIAAILLILTGLMGLVYEHFSYTRETQEAMIGPFELTFKEVQTVNIPVWAGLVAILAGGGLLLIANKKD